MWHEYTKCKIWSVYLTFVKLKLTKIVSIIEYGVCPSRVVTTLRNISCKNKQLANKNYISPAIQKCQFDQMNHKFDPKGEIY